MTIFKDSEIEDTIDRILENHEIKLNDIIYLLEITRDSTSWVG